MRGSGEHTGRTINPKLGAGHWVIGDLLGSGNEGEVYALSNDPHYAVKVYHANRRPDPQHAAKLFTMESRRPPGPVEIVGSPTLTWPVQLVRDTDGGQVVGFVMDRIDLGVFVPIGAYCNPDVRRRMVPADLLGDRMVDHVVKSAVINLTQTFHRLHESGVLIGDVNDHNLVLNPRDGFVSILDCDSFQITDPSTGKVYPCPVGRPEYTAPEILDEQNAFCRRADCDRAPDPHKTGYSCVVRNQQHDLFAMAVVIFKLFMSGSHPYDCVYHGPEALAPHTLRDRIQRRYFPYGPNRPFEVSPPPGKARQYHSLPAAIQRLFERAF